MSSVDITNDSQRLVVTSRECGTCAHALGRVQNRAIQLQAKLYHRVRFVNVIRRKQAGSQSAKFHLHARKDGAGRLQASGHIKHPEQYSLRMDADEIVEVAGLALPVIDRRQICPTECRNFGAGRFIRRRRRRLAASERKTHERARRGYHNRAKKRVWKLVSVFAGQILGDFGL